MPGVFGASHARVGQAISMRRFFDDAWGNIQWTQTVGGGGIGVHTYGMSGTAVASDGSLSAWDGGFGIYAHPPQSEDEAPRGGNVVRIRADGSVVLRSDLAGLFPLYYSASEEGIVFSSLLRPLARVLAASSDSIGIAQFLRYAFTFGGRTIFKGIGRLAPGEVATWSPRGGLERRDGSNAWVDPPPPFTSPEEVAEAAEPLIAQALRDALPPSGASVLMMSAGWDSRTLLAGAARELDPGALSAFSHGDLSSRELRISRELCRRASVPWAGRQIGPDVWDEDHLERMFRRTESLVFPHWGWAGRTNAEADTVFSGVLGEVLGGHYGATQVTRGFRKAFELLRGLGSGGDAGGQRREAEALDALRVSGLGRLWYLHEEAEGDRLGLLEAFNTDVDRHLDRLRERGVRSASRLVEAFVTEHRGVQYIGAQALSTRVAVDVSAPFADPRLLAFASRIPAALKIHNRVNRALGRRLSPELARLPTAAVLVPSSWPILLQEGSRVLRRGYEEARWGAYLRTRGRWGRPRLGWVDFEFLREGSVLDGVVSGLRCDMWDRSALSAAVRNVRSFDFPGRLHPLFDQMGKILTVDRLVAGD